MKHAFDWKCHPKAEEFINQLIQKACNHNQAIDDLKENLYYKTSTKLFDFIDHIVLGRDKETINTLHALGFEIERTETTKQQFIHKGALFPAIVIDDESQDLAGLAIKVDFIEDFLMVRGITAEIEGSPLSGFRKAQVVTDNGVTLWVVERRATRSLHPTMEQPNYLQDYLEAKQSWKTRPRSLHDRQEAMEITLYTAEKIAHKMGRDLAAWIILECEREYWQSKNFAAQLQYNRQNHLGMGWANHDHHTFRSSRVFFKDLVKLFELLGFHCRERYYTGKEGGWGAQIMENSRAGLILFLDVDLTPEEVDIDFAHERLHDSTQLNSVGLWCALHGDSILKAGMHHLEAQFSFDALTQSLDNLGVGMMAPFSNFPYLKQAFTQPEKWAVDKLTLDQLVKEKKITETQANIFENEGAVGSHLENLERKEGYKGFNQKNVTTIIKKTDPRLMSHSSEDNSK